MPSVAIIGTRGYPSYYGGFETAVRKIGPHLADAGWDVTVYGRRGSVGGRTEERDERILSRQTKGLESQKLSTLTYGLTSSLDAAMSRPDVALVMNVANGYFLPMLRARGIPTLVNVDGLEWERDKWSPLAKRVFRGGAASTARWATRLVFDARAIHSYWQKEFGVDGIFIPYGGDVPPAMPVPDGLAHRGYVVMVARFVPENSVPEFFAAVPKIASKHPVIIVGSTGYGGEMDEKAGRLACQHPNVSWLGHVRDDTLLLSLWQHAGVYFHGHSVGGTNPALVQAMAAGAPILARDTVYNREVLGPTGGRYFSPSPGSIEDAVFQMMSSEIELEESCAANVERARDIYSWTGVCDAYERSLRDLLES